MEKLHYNRSAWYYHICSDGNFSSCIFQTEEDFKAAMNRVAVCAFKTGVVIVAFVLMDNHFHFEVYAKDYESCVRFANEFKRMTGQYIASQGGGRNALVSLPVQVIPVEDEDYVRALLCYIIKNPTKARIAMFYEYRWGTGSLYFRSFPCQGAAVYRVGDLSVDERRRRFRTKVKIPGDWIVSDGVILPQNYVPVKAVEDLFKTPRSFMYFLSLNKDDEMEKDMGDWHELFMKDSELCSLRDEMIVSMFGKGRLRDLSADERLQLAKSLRYKYQCSRKQLARVVQLPYDQLKDRI